MNFEEVVEKDFSGCISVIKNREVIFEKNYGYADLSNKNCNKIDTKFGTASAGKAFVSVEILQLIENGKLSFDDEIGNLLDFDLKEIDKKFS